MHQRWTLHIENFAKIKQADIELHPLTLLVGENNSGKSYVATLIWAVCALSESIYPVSVPTSDSYEKCKQVVQCLLEQQSQDANKELKLTVQDQQLFVDWFNDVLRENKEKLLEEAFQKTIPIGQLFIKNYSRKETFNLSKEESLKTIFKTKEFGLNKSKSFAETDLERQLSVITEDVLYSIIKHINYSLLFSGYNDGSTFYQSIEAMWPGYLGPVLKPAPLFLPASRTGFMISYPALVADALEGSAVKLTKPIQMFLKGLTQKSLARIINNKNKRLITIADWLENELLKGTIERIDTERIPQYQYRGFDSNNTLPIYLTSSLVAEVAPIVYFLRAFDRYSAFFIEEPEAHLHPSAQRIMARAIARLKNEGLPVVITTHGDTLFQQLNNLAVLHGHPKQKELMKELGYCEQELLDPQDMVAYQFKKTPEGTVIEKLEPTEYGIPVPTFNEPLQALLNEVYKLQESE